MLGDTRKSRFESGQARVFLKMKQAIFVDLERFEEPLKEELKKVFSKGEKIAVKLHMGEATNTRHLSPEFVSRVVKVMKELGLEPFLFDSLVRYNAVRNTEEGYQKLAEQKGFTKICPVITTNDSIKVKMENMTYEICKALTEADGVLVLTHLKGHGFCGFGGSIKNLGMGAVTKKTKGHIHDGGKPELTGECTKCGLCAENCPPACITYDEKGPVFGASCFSCSNCCYVCPQKAIKPKLAPFDELLAEGAIAALKNFKKSYFVNVMNNITKSCDCAPDSEIVFDDIGIIMSKDLVIADKACFDVINEKAGKDLFKEVNKKTPLIHIKKAAEILGTDMEYELKRKV